ncbi:hypothetical protein CC85DRAFT_278473 [Cutaneotrichosporon oleaginosum]|uniref:Uncharacterized protein n=1 Tax=Cutaneotrichosporon oleaginosum TaxID=879819 RepID=A0A0J0XG63_9TREE|nr:uncharacterized protein CC85DRAFT_278473 [Cutaneotrichosporon oleaginosum]KLT40052.1 hypothetical protein CC85DRAFT_278473 [Cutaneotrichosporon oleaginosum]
MFPLGVDDEEWRSNTITVRERAMLMFINSVTDKPEWARKVHDETIVAKWKAELADMVAKAGNTRVSEGGSLLVNGFSDAMFEYCLLELRDKATADEASARDGTGGITMVLDTAAAVFKADGRVPEDVRASLLDAVKPLEAQEPDWHPGSDGKVLDLVHPSLWPLVYGTTTQLDSEMGMDEAISLIGSGEVVPVPTAASLGLGKPSRRRMWSKRFQWLPCEISFGPDGKGQAQVTSYINNAHPAEHAALYPVVARVIDAALPMLQAAYDCEAAFARKRIICNESNRKCTVPELCKTSCNGRNIPKEEIPEGIDEDDDNMYEIESEWFYRVHPVAQPEPQAYGTLPAPPRVTLPPEDWPLPADKRLQVIVKLANIHLTPEKPRYDGGSWHFEGQANEHIVGTALYYYDVENVTESRLAFRTVCDAEDYNEGGFEYEQGDHEPFDILYGVNPSGWSESKVQMLGDVATTEGRLLVFPNVLQHQVQPFELVDKTRPGHRKILALFLVDPAVRVPSTATVPPQQKEWREASVLDERLPPELSQMIFDNLTVPYGLDKAKALREELIEERKAVDKNVDEIMSEETWCFCEH